MAKARTGTMRQRKPGVWQLIASIEKKQRLIDNLTKMDRLVQRIEDRQRKYETFHGTEAEAQARLAAMQAESDGADESPSKPESTEGRPWGQPLKKAAGAPLNLG